GTGNAERAARSGLGELTDRAEAATEGRGARGIARAAQPGEPATADRMLRHLEHPGLGARRLDGRLPGCDPEEGPLPEVRGAGARRPGRLRGGGKGDRAPPPRVERP